MKIKKIIPAIVLAVALHLQAFADDGAKIFTANCGACHTVGKGRLVGPDLKGIGANRSEKWLLKWIKSSQTLVKEGDTAAVKLFADYSSIPMPDQALSDIQIKAILGYLNTGGTVTASADTTSSETQAVAKTAAAKPTASETNTDNSGKYVELVNPDTFLINLGYGILITFFLVIVWVLASALKNLSDSLKKD